jgi:TatD DNase family protein
MLFDAHAHINQDTFTDEERAEIIREAERSQLLSYVLDAGFDLPSSKQAIKDAEENSWIYAAVGVHPHDTDSMTEEILGEIEKLAAHPKAVAIGEIGLDFHYDFSDRENQRKWFRRQIQLANNLKMPIMIHTREADEETFNILCEEGAFSEERKTWFRERKGPDGTPESHAAVLLHCYSGSAELAKEYVKKGATISICGPVTYKNNKKTVRVVEEIPLCYLTAETDSPYLTPEPLRGKKNRPWYVEHTVRRIADIKGITFEEAAETTCENALIFFGITH